MAEKCTNALAAKTRDDVAKVVAEMICDQIGCDAEEVDLSADLVTVLGADSLDVIELIMWYEDEFDIEIPDEDAEKMNTAGAAVEFICKQKGIAA